MYLFTLQAFWDYKEKKQLGTTKAEWSVTSEWSPDGRYFMTATTAPRLQVDNGYVNLCYILAFSRYKSQIFGVLKIWKFSEDIACILVI